MSAEPVRFTCPRCAKRYKTPPERIEAAGGRLGVLCSRCHARLRVRLAGDTTETDLLSDAPGAPGAVEEAVGDHDADELMHEPTAAGPSGTSLSVGAQLGRYQIEGVLGQGGMGTVYKAFDPSVNRSVALKVLDPDAPPEDAARFEREVQVQANVKHPNLMPIYDSGASDGLRWYTMELLREPLSLRDLVLMVRSGEAGRSPRLKPASSFAGLVEHVLIPVCRAIHHANVREGVLHRDLSPYNVLVDAAGLRPYVIDFGVCTLLERKNPRLQDLPLETSPVIGGQRKVTGTLAYMPPEQLRGQSDRRSDVWALGALLHSSVTGEPPLLPVAKGSVPKADRIEGLKLLIEQALRDGDVAEVARFRNTMLALQEGRERTTGDLHKDILQGNYQPRPPWLDRALDAVIAKAMAVDPAQRYRNGKELADDLESWLAGGAVAALAEQQSGVGRLVYSTKRAFQRHTGLVAGVVLALLGVGVYALWNRGPDERPLADRKADAERAYRAAMAEPVRPAPDASGVLLRRWIALDPQDSRPWQTYQEVIAKRQHESRGERARVALAAFEHAETTADAATLAAAGVDLERAAESLEPGERERLQLRARGKRIVRFQGRVQPEHLRQVDVHGHVGAAVLSLPAGSALAYGRWVAVSEAGRHISWLSFEVVRGEGPLTFELPAFPDSAPENMVLVPAGRVKGPLGESQVPALLWERTEVTVERYATWLQTLAADEQALRVPRVAGSLGGAARPLWEKRDGKLVPPKSLAAQSPVDGISLYDARAFAAAAGRRLPTAQEWAWAASGTFADASPVGDADDLFSLPLVLGSGSLRPAAVGGTEDDVCAFGLRDLAGNVAEWTSTLTTLEGTNGWLVMGSGYGLPPERALVSRAVPEPGWMPIQGVGFRCVLPAP